MSCEENDEVGKMSMAYTLESRECSDGPFARAMIIPSEESPVNSSNKVTSLHVCKGKNHPVHPTSKIMYGPRLDKWSRKARCENEEEAAAVRETAPASFIGCTASKKQATARITKCHTREDGAPGLGAKRCLETHVPRNSDRPTAVSFVCPLEKPTACHHSVMEARVDECGPRTRMVSYPHEDNFSGYMESRNVEDGPAARIMQQSLDTVNETSGYYVAEGGAEEDEGRKLCRTSSGCATNCAKKSKQLQCEGRPAAPRQDVAEGGNDDNSKGRDEYLGMRRFPRGKMCPNYCCKQTVRPKSCMTKYEKDCRKPERRAQPPVCPPSAERPKTCTDAAQRGKRPEEGVKTYKFLLLPCTIVDKSRMAAAAGAEDCTRPKEKRERLDCGEEKAREKVDECEEEEEIPKISSEELLTRYRDYFSPNTLHRYEVCRSKRNGLQDQCKLPIPRAVIELKMKELRSGRRKG